MGNLEFPINTLTYEAGITAVADIRTIPTPRVLPALPAAVTQGLKKENIYG
jgi:hypothetical protein